MKKIVIITLLFFVIPSGYSQQKKSKKKVTAVSTVSAKKSKFEVGINAGFDIQKGVNNLSRNYANTTLYTGYFINPKTEIGLRAGKSFISEAPNYSFGIFGRRYFKKFYGGLGYNRTLYTIPKVDSFNNEYKTYQNLNSLNLDSGYRFEVTKKMKIETGLNIEMFLNKETKIASTAYGIRAGIVYGF
jgi:hypothetical protein